MQIYETTDIVGSSVDELVLKGIEHVGKCGERLDARTASGIQTYNVNYVLTDSRNRVHCLRFPRSVRYMCRELLLYFSGSLLAQDMAKASAFWLRLQDADGLINSNYGHYVFHRQTPEGISQYEWCARLLVERPQTRRAVININSIEHKNDTRDMPCNMGLQFFVQSGMLCCVAYTRSADVLTGLPYDMAFFSLLNELLWRDLCERGVKNLGLGYCMMRTCFTQIYIDKSGLVDSVLERAQLPRETMLMPVISSASEVIADIVHQTSNSQLVRWCHQHAEY